jgi:hypothetical protein
MKIVNNEEVKSMPTQPGLPYPSTRICMHTVLSAVVADMYSQQFYFAWY